MKAMFTVAEITTIAGFDLSWARLADALKTALGFAWKAGWAFVLGYFVSAMIQAFVPRQRLSERMGDQGWASIGLATGFGAISSSCSFAALGAARAMIAKGASFVAGVAFMFASTNLVIELGILIVIFLGWHYLIAELLGGLVLIAISTTLIRWTAPTSLLDRARARAEDSADAQDEDFDWRERITSLSGWQRVGHRFVMEWKMVWKEILVGFTVAGFVAEFVPERAWQALFLADRGDIPGPLRSLENALVGPLVAACTFIGSMGNIPLATVLASSGAAFAGVMAFIYSDLMIPPLVRVNAKYYGWRGALYIAGIMYASIVVTALLLDGVLALFELELDSPSSVAEITTFALDYSFGLNLGFAALAIVLIVLGHGHDHDHD